MKGSLDNMTKKMDKLVEFLDKKSPEEQKAVDMVARHGGEAAVVGVSQANQTAAHAYNFLVPCLGR
jgi:hypothetical protein